MIAITLRLKQKLTTCPAVTDDGRNRLRVIQDVSQQARFSLVTFFVRTKKVTHRHCNKLNTAEEF